VGPAEESDVALRILSALAVATLALSAVASPPDPSSLPEVSAQSVDPPTRLDRVVVAPLNLAVRTPADLAGKGDPVWSELLHYFQERDRQLAVINTISAERLWLQAIDAVDVSAGSAALRAAEARFARELARHREYDLLVIPSLVLRPGHLSGTHAFWDGVQREVPNAAILVGSGLADVVAPGGVVAGGLRGKVAAVSLHVTLLRSDGSEVFEGLGGLDVLQEAQREAVWGSRLRFVTRSEPFSDPEAVREGVERAFDGPTLTAARGW
jgi:hypothetical protein